MPEVQRIMYICQIAINQYVEDIREFVSTAVKDEIKSTIAEFSAVDPRTCWARTRKAKLYAWLASDYPCSYANSNVPFMDLLNAISVEEEHTALGLPSASVPNISLAALVDTLWDMGRPVNPLTLQAPIIATGAFGNVLRTCIKLSLPITQNDPQPIKTALMHAIAKKPLNFVPGAPPRHGPGRPFKNVSLRHWIQIGEKNISSSIAATPESLLTIPQARVRRLQQTAETARSANVNASWDIDAITVSRLAECIQFEQLPNDWLTAHVDKGPDGYVKETFDWAYMKLQTNYSNPMCKLAVFLGAIWSKACPECMYACDLEKTSETVCGTSMEDITRFVRRTPWVIRNERRGVREVNIFLRQATIYILAMIDSESPLRKSIAANKNCIGAAWTDKYCAGSRCSFYGLVH